jgi:hypothetical protein
MNLSNQPRVWSDRMNGISNYENDRISSFVRFPFCKFFVLSFSSLSSSNSLPSSMTIVTLKRNTKLEFISRWNIQSAQKHSVEVPPHQSCFQHFVSAFAMKVTRNGWRKHHSVLILNEDSGFRDLRMNLFTVPTFDGIKSNENTISHRCVERIIKSTRAAKDLKWVRAEIMALRFTMARIQSPFMETSNFSFVSAEWDTIGFIWKREFRVHSGNVLRCSIRKSVQILQKSSLKSMENRAQLRKHFKQVWNFGQLPNKWLFDLFLSTGDSSQYPREESCKFKYVWRPINTSNRILHCNELHFSPLGSRSKPLQELCIAMNLSVSLRILTSKSHPGSRNCSQSCQPFRLFQFSIYRFSYFQ